MKIFEIGYIGFHVVKVLLKEEIEKSINWHKEYYVK